MNKAEKFVLNRLKCAPEVDGANYPLYLTNEVIKKLRLRMDQKIPMEYIKAIAKFTK